MTFLAEADIEQALLADLAALGYQTTTEAQAGPDGSAPEREAYADVLLFINGLPLVVIELKSPSSEQATLQTAYTQLQTYKAEIPSLFRTNAALVISDGQLARIELPEARSLSWTRSWMS